MRIQLSKNFYLDEFTHSQIAARHGIDIVVKEDSQDFRNLKYLCESILQPLRDSEGPLHLSSGFRPLAVNKLARGSRSSGHIHGLCADVISYTRTPMQLCKAVISLGVPFDQLILEYGAWMHVGTFSPRRERRRQVKTAYRVKTKHKLEKKTKYIMGLHKKENAVNA